ncbi:hypothetical protein AYO22_07865 [Fonsecaea multimorphosa]|nr:hypothetical protein AYO22_07865 [Fonsecaea multimorphosa]
MEQSIIHDTTIHVNPSEPSESVLGGDTTLESPTYPQLLTPTNDDHTYSPSTEGQEVDQQDGFYADYRSKDDDASTYKKVGFASRLSSLSLILESSRRFNPLATTPNPKTTISLKLVSNSQIHSLLDLFFADIDLVLPMMERDHMTERISSLLRDLGLSETGDYVVHVTMEKCPLAALLCAILATAENLGSDSIWSTQSKISGWAWYVQMQTLLQHFAKQYQPDIDVLRCFTLSSFYLLTLGKFHEASEAIGLASQLAIASQLNVQDALLYTKDAHARHYKRLWWSIYVMDQQISRIGGTPYWIRDRVTAVDDVQTTNRDASNLQNTGFSATVNAGLDYLQVLVHLARIGREIWDQQISIRQNTTLDRVMAANIDSQLLRLSSGLPSHLAWRKLGVRGDDGLEPSHPIWQRLIISNDHDSMLICQQLARTSVADIATVMDISEATPRSVGVHLSTSLTDFLWHLLSPAQTKKDFDLGEETVEYFRTACSILEDLSQTDVAARRAVAALQDLPLRGSNTVSTVEHGMRSTALDVQTQHPVAASDSAIANLGKQSMGRDPFQASGRWASSSHPSLEMWAGFSGPFSNGTMPARRNKVDAHSAEGHGCPSAEEQTGNLSPPVRTRAVDDLSKTYGDLDLYWRTTL